MTTTVDNTYERYVISATGPYAFSFRIFNNTDLTVVAISGSTVVPLSLTTHYTVSGTNDPDGGSITLVSGVQTTYAGYTLDIRSNTPVDQPTNILNNSRFLPVTHQDAFDYLSRQNQDQERRASLSPRFPDNEIAPDWATLLSLANRKGKYYGFFNATTGAPELVSGFSTTAITQGNVGAALYPQTAAEIAAGVTPTNYYVPSHEALGRVRPTRYGGVSDDSTNSNSALANSLLVCAQSSSPLDLSDGEGYVCTTNLTVPVGIGNAVEIIGGGWSAGGIRFSGAGVTTGLTFTGSTYSYCGSITDCRIRGGSGAIRGATFTDVTNAYVARCHFSGFAGAALYFAGTLMSKLDHVLVTGSGSATEGSVEVDMSGSIQSTTFRAEQLYISGGNTTIGGLIINRTYNFTITGGAIESCGIPLRIANRSDSTVGIVGGIVHGMDFENPGNNPYIEIGAGLTTVYASAIDVRGCNGSPSGSSTVAHAVRLYRCNGVAFGSNNWSCPNGTSIFELESTGNIGVQIESHRNLYDATGIAWVRVNDVQDLSGGPQCAWNSNTVLKGLTSEKTVTGTDPTASISDTQGGYHERILLNNGGATNMATLTGLREGCTVYLRGGNANTTLVHNPGVANAFRCKSGANTLVTSGQLLMFVKGATDLVQLA